jgi:predicted RNA-binding protein with PIN domain
MQPPGPHDPPTVLPEPVRRAVLALAAEVLSTLPEPAVPAALRRVRSFAPAKRASAGAGSLAAALERDPTFRTAVAGGWREQHPELAELVQSGPWPATADPVQLAVGLYLTRPQDWADRLAEALTLLRDQSESPGRDRPEESSGRLDVLERSVARWRALAEQAQAELATAQEQLGQSRRELRRLRADGDRARAQAREAAAELAQLRADASKLEIAQLAALRAAQDRVRRAEEEAALARRAARDGRSLAGARARLLLDTVVEAATGLRRELALPPQTLLPADLVAGEHEPPGAATEPGTEHRPRARAADDPSVLDGLIRLPRAHLVVDGYNVTKTGYPSLTLAEQRSRLVDALTPLAARTGAETTCCFDGADVPSRSSWLNRGVRVIFSEPGTTADELIRRLVRAEPVGRPLVVVSSDAEVAASALAAGARAVPSTALLRLLERGRAG